MKRSIIVGISGASGVGYGIELLRALAEAEIESHLVISRWAAEVIAEETIVNACDVHKLAGAVHDNDNLAAPIASSSYQVDGMVVIPANLKECQVGLSGGALLLLIGLLAAGGQLLMTWSFKYIRVALGSLLGLLTTVINVLAGILIFGEKLLPVSIAGCVLVIASCALMVMVEKPPVAPAPRAR